MSSERKFNSAEIHAMLKLNEQHYSETKISEIINKSGKVIVNLLQDPDNYAERKSCGRLQCLTARGKTCYNTCCRKS